MRPLLLSLLPPRLRLSVWSRLYRPNLRHRIHLYSAAGLSLAPGATMDLVPGDLVSDCIAYTGIHELALSKRVVHLARQGGTLVDVGANLGYFVLLWACAARANRCLAIEPSPRNLELLRGNVARNALADRVQVAGAAAGREHGTMAFDPGPADQTGWGGLAVVAGRTTFAVETVRLDDIAGHLPSVELLKVDAEGADGWVLVGAERLLRERRIGEIWFEQNKPRMRALGIEETEPERFLQAAGYRPRPATDPSADIVQWTAVPRS